MRFQGSICAIVTPFDANGAPDLEAFDRLLGLHLAAATDGIVVSGSTGESAALDESESDALLGAALGRLHGRKPVIAGCGAAATHKALRLVRRARALGADAALVVTPYYVRPTQEGLYRHYATLADEGGLPVILYNVPGRTGCDLLPETVARLAARTGIAGIKEARAEPERMQALLPLRRADFCVLSGDDPSALRAMEAGADGTISVAANVVPRAFARLCALARAGESGAAQALERELLPIYRILGVESNPIPAKWLLHRLGLIGAGLRLPLVELSPAWRVEAEACVARIRQLEAAADPASARVA
ncbi:MAG: 4-hydroxy-tetrahydrodipicolinate synthase [Xanthomonadales bacterium]|nr:4-hydroxy-tetrahydrodipicolinate synthase [Xanthomonadales bacterium]